MEEAVYLLGGLRSPIGLTGGVFQAIRPEELGAALFRAIFAKLPEARKADEVMGGNAVGSGGNLMRLTALMAGLDEKVPALTLDMQCASAAAAIVMGYAKIRSGLSDLIICGGLESTSLQPLRQYAPKDPRYHEKRLHGGPVFPGYDKSPSHARRRGTDGSAL